MISLTATVWYCAMLRLHVWCTISHTSVGTDHTDEEEEQGE